MGKTVTIATKVTTETLAALEAMALRRHTSVYDLVLSAIMMLLRLGSKQVALSDTVKRSWHAFEHEFGALSVANLATLKQQDIVIKDAIYRVFQHGKQEATLMHMGNSFLSQPGIVNINHEQIVAMVMQTAYPKTYQLLKQVQEENRLNSMMHAISFLIHEYCDQMLDQQIDELFGDNSRAENCRSLDDQRPYKHKRSKTIYSKDRQTTINFENDEQGQELQPTDRKRPLEEARFEDEDGI